MSWARAIGLEPKEWLDLLEAAITGAMATTKGVECETVKAHFPGEREHTEALLRKSAGERTRSHPAAHRQDHAERPALLRRTHAREQHRIRALV